MTAGSLVSGNQYFRETYSLHLQAVFCFHYWGMSLLACCMFVYPLVSELNLWLKGVMRKNSDKKIILTFQQR
jgi:hypothetical protein